ncbi:MAG: twin-arginine translocase TatA/TatE family subunit [Chloroflexi bacterium]|nr:twin-arginine translocase TatA/TatE family subunit [Chloroflexota bacterium]
MPFKLGPTELIIILVIVFLLFGASRLPQIGSGFGQAIRGFKNAITGEDEKKEKKAARSRRKKEGKA